jgi:CIC family chloride channel protein
MLGGAGVGLIAFVWPQVLGSGHGAIQEVIASHPAPTALALVVVAKALASALSVGSGFRGGLFSSALFLGSLYGSATGGEVARLFPSLPIHPLMMGVIIASMIVRLTFGYSFATWRFHLRGVPILSATDIGWVRDLTVAKLMREDAHTAAEDLPLAEFRQLYPLGGPKRVFLTDGDGNYAGIVISADAHNHDLDERLGGLKARDIRHGESEFLLPHQNVRTALDRFLNAELEVLPVLASAVDRKILGFMTEAYALRRYNQELERARGEDLMANTLFGPATRARAAE